MSWAFLNGLLRVNSLRKQRVPQNSRSLSNSFQLNEKTQIEPFSSNLESRLTKNLSEARVRAIDAAMQVFFLSSFFIHSFFFLLSYSILEIQTYLFQMLRSALGCTLTKPYFTWIENNFPTMIESKYVIRVVILERVTKYFLVFIFSWSFN